MERQVLLEKDPDSNVYTATVPSLPGVVTEGEGIEGALAMVREAIQLYVETLRAHGEDVPEEIGQLQVVTVRVSAEV